MEKIIKPKSNFNLNIKELWDYRELFFFFAWRDIKVKYKQTLLGFLWAVLQPLVVMLIFVFFFSKILNVPTGNVPAPIFYFSGLLLWNLFSSGLAASANSMIENAEIIKKIYFPRLIVPLASVLVAFFDFLMAFFVFIAFAIAYHLFYENLSFNFFRIFVYAPLALVIVLITTFGAGSLLAALNVKYRDFRYIIPFIIQLLLFVSPVIYPTKVLDSYPIIQKLIAINPLAGALNLTRGIFSNNAMDWLTISISGLSTIFLFLSGVFIFRKTESYFADLA